MKNTTLKRFKELRGFNDRNSFGKSNNILSKITGYYWSLFPNSPKPLNLTAANESLLIDNMDLFRSNGFEFVINKDGTQ